MGLRRLVILPEHPRSITHTLSLVQPLAGSGKADVEPLLGHSREHPPFGEGGARAIERTNAKKRVPAGGLEPPTYGNLRC